MKLLIIFIVAILLVFVVHSQGNECTSSPEKQCVDPTASCEKDHFCGGANKRCLCPDGSCTEDRLQFCKTDMPTFVPTQSPISTSSTFNPTLHPITMSPSFSPSFHPSSITTNAPTPSIAFDPTIHPTMNPTSNPTMNPPLSSTTSNSLKPITLAPTIRPIAADYVTNLNVRLDIVINDPSLNETDIANTIKNTTNSYLSTLTAAYKYNLSVTIINRQNDILSVRILVLSEDEMIELNEEEVINQNDKEIESKYGDRADLKNPYIPNDENYRKTSQYLLYTVIGLAVIAICCGIVIVTLCIKLKRRRSMDSSNAKNKQETEICLSVVEVEANGTTPAKESYEDEEGKGVGMESIKKEIEKNEDDEDDLDDMYKVVSPTSNGAGTKDVVIVD